MTRAFLATALLLGLAACGGPSQQLWACVGQSDLLLTENDQSLTIFNVNNATSITLSEVQEGKLWSAGPISWQIVGLDHALFKQVNGNTINCRRPG